MRPTTADDNVFDFNALLHPGTVFEHPKDVVLHAGLTTAEKRAILASWASDASAIASCPVAALTCRTEEADIDRRNPRGLVRTGWWAPESSGRQALSVALYRTRHGRLKIGGCS